MLKTLNFGFYGLRHKKMDKDLKRFKHSIIIPGPIIGNGKYTPADMPLSLTTTFKEKLYYFKNTNNEIIEVSSIKSCSFLSDLEKTIKNEKIFFLKLGENLTYKGKIDGEYRESNIDKVDSKVYANIIKIPPEIKDATERQIKKRIEEIKDEIGDVKYLIKKISSAKGNINFSRKNHVINNYETFEKIVFKESKHSHSFSYSEIDEQNREKLVNNYYEMILEQIDNYVIYLNETINNLEKRPWTLNIADMSFTDKIKDFWIIKDSNKTYDQEYYISLSLGKEAPKKVMAICKCDNKYYEASYFLLTSKNDRWNLLFKEKDGEIPVKKEDVDIIIKHRDLVKIVKRNY